MQGDKDQWLLLHKHDDHAVDGWDPEDHPRSVKSGRTNDEVKAAPAATWSSQSLWAGPTDDELAALDALGKAGEWTLGEHTLRLTNLDKVLFPAKPGRGGAKALTKRDLIRHHAVMAPAMLPYLADRPVNLHRFPDGIDKPGFWHKAVPDARARLDHPLALRGPRPGRDRVVLRRSTRPPRSPGWRTTAPSSCTRGPRRRREPHQPTWAMIDIDPGTKATFDDALVLARLYRTALDHLGVEACPKVTGKRGIQIWVPVRRRLRVRGHQRVGGAPVARHRRHRARPGELGVGEGQARRPHPARLHPERHQQDPRRPVQRPPGAGRAGVGADRLGRARRPRPGARIDGRSATVGDRLAEAGDPLAPLIGRQQRLPAL